MSGEANLEKLLQLMQPELLPGKFVFCSYANAAYGDYAELKPIAAYQEREGLSLIIAKAAADEAGIEYHSAFCGISLSVHSSLDAVGFTAAIAGKLSANGITANVVAACYHDHVFVPADKAEDALQLLREFQA